jgi:hypothetical protein
MRIVTKARCIAALKQVASLEHAFTIPSWSHVHSVSVDIASPKLAWMPSGWKGENECVFVFSFSKHSGYDLQHSKSSSRLVDVLSH